MEQHFNFNPGLNNRNHGFAPVPGHPVQQDPFTSNNQQNVADGDPLSIYNYWNSIYEHNAKIVADENSVIQKQKEQYQEHQNQLVLRSLYLQQEQLEIISKYDQLMKQNEYLKERTLSCDMRQNELYLYRQFLEDQRQQLQEHRRQQSLRKQNLSQEQNMQQNLPQQDQQQNLPQQNQQQNLQQNIPKQENQNLLHQQYEQNSSQPDHDQILPQKNNQLNTPHQQHYQNSMQNQYLCLPREFELYKNKKTQQYHSHVQNPSLQSQSQQPLQYFHQQTQPLFQQDLTPTWSHQQQSKQQQNLQQSKQQPNLLQSQQQRSLPESQQQQNPSKSEKNQNLKKSQNQQAQNRIKYLEKQLHQLRQQSQKNASVQSTSSANTPKSPCKLHLCKYVRLNGKPVYVYQCTDSVLGVKNIASDEMGNALSSNSGVFDVSGDLDKYHVHCFNNQGDPDQEEVVTIEDDRDGNDECISQSHIQ